MQVKFKFICCTDYDFTDGSGKQVKGISCRCFDPKTEKIVKVKTDKKLDYKFGDEVLVNVVPNGNYVNYEIA